jgi:hypothetical protein
MLALPLPLTKLQRIWTVRDRGYAAAMTEQLDGAINRLGWLRLLPSQEGF